MNDCETCEHLKHDPEEPYLLVCKMTGMALGIMVECKHKLQLKICSKCGTKYPATKKFFYSNETAKDGLQSWCRECHHAVCIEFLTCSEHTALHNAGCVMGEINEKQKKTTELYRLMYLRAFDKDATPKEKRRAGLRINEIRGFEFIKGLK